jgi:hypothetical protein
VTSTSPDDAFPTEYRLRVGGQETMDDLVQAGAYDGVHSAIGQAHFPVAPRDPFEVVVRLVDLGRIAWSRDAVSAFGELGLRRPTPEEAVRFGCQHPNAQRHRPIVWPHEPFEHVDGPRVLVHFGGTGYRSLDLYPDSAWGAYCLFAGVQS